MNKNNICHDNCLGRNSKSSRYPKEGGPRLSVRMASNIHVSARTHALPQATQDSAGLKGGGMLLLEAVGVGPCRRQGYPTR